MPAMDAHDVNGFLMPQSEQKNCNIYPQPSVSVVIPLYNKGLYIDRTLSSIFAQEYQPLEIIIVDDGSTDDGLERVQAYSDPRINLIRNSVNMGPGAARNVGLALAKGRYVSFLDADDEWHPLFLNTTVSCLDRNGSSAALASTGYTWHSLRKSTDYDFADLRGEYEIETSTSLALLSAIETCVSLCFTVIRTDVARRWGGYYEAGKCLRGEDQYFLLKLLLNEKIVIIPEPHGVYHTEGSALFGRMQLEVPETEPYLSDPADLIEACPPSKRRLLEQFLVVKALDRAMLLVKLGQRRSAIELIDRFVAKRSQYSKRALVIRAIACVAPLVPLVRAIWRRTKDRVSHFR
jgi:GT2 family glycosyltransferase